MRRVLVGLICMCASAAPAPIRAYEVAQQAPTFRGGISLVTIDLTVLDESGKPVPGLTADDLEIKLNGKVQAIRALAFVQTAAERETTAVPIAPVAAPAPAPAEPVARDEDTRRTISNAAPAAADTPAAPVAPAVPSESRVFVIVVDDLSFAAQRGKAMFRAAERFLDRVPPSDPVGFTTTTGIGALNPTLDREAVRAALAKVVGQFNDPRGMRKTGPAGAARFGSADSPLGISESIDIERGDESLLKDVIIRECFNGDRAAFNGVSLAEMLSRSDPCPSDVQREARQVAGLVRQNKGRQIAGVMSVIRAMKTAAGIRHLVLLSDGLPVSREVSDLNPLVRAAAEAGVQLSVLLEGPDISVTDDARGGGNPGEHAADAGQSRRRREDDVLMVNGLQTMTEMLGGSFYRVVGTPDPFFDRVIAASSAVYRLGVELPAGSKPGDVYNVTASVKRPGLKARANRFTVAAAPHVPEVVAGPAKAITERVAPPPAAAPIDDVLKAALNSNTAAGDVPIRIAAFVRRSAGVEGHVDVSVNVAIAGTVTGPVTTYFGIVDAADAVRSSRRVLDAPGPSGYTASFLVPLPPGEYRVRYAAADAARAIGTVELPVRAALAPIGPFTASDVLTWFEDEAGKAQLFAIEDVPAGAGPLRASIELYPGGTRSAEPPAVRWTLSREGEAAPLQSEDVSAHAGPSFFRADAEFAFDALPAGRYIIRAALLIDGRPAGAKAAIVRKR